MLQNMIQKIVCNVNQWLEASDLQVFLMFSSLLTSVIEFIMLIDPWIAFIKQLLVLL